jgi:acetyl-CoA carboxylase carboxyl transferase subunit beta
VVYDIRDYAAFVTGGELAAGDDAVVALWVSPADAAALDGAGRLTAGLLETLRSWAVFSP